MRSASAAAASVWGRAQIESALEHVDVLAAMERAFTVYSNGGAVVPPVGELLFDEPPGDAHIKYGYIRGDDHFVVKVATGFYENARSNLPANSGLVLMFSARTGLPSAVLLDEGYLTNIRTAAAGAVAAKYLAPSEVTRIGVCGTGVQARMQIEQLKRVTPCRRLMVWGRSAERVRSYCRDMTAAGFAIDVAASPRDLTRECNLVVTATTSHVPLLEAGDLHPGLHITALGADTPDKHELAPALLASADLLVVDSLSQCRERGDLHHALKAGLVTESDVVELGNIVGKRARGRSSDVETTVCDLTGVAVQDIEISKAVLEYLKAT